MYVQSYLCRSEQEYDEICTNEGTMSEAECSAYQALNLDKMNCDSMYMKVMTSKK